MFDINHLIQTGGLLLIALIIFAESGMLVGMFFPGDTLLFSAGILAAQPNGLPLIPTLLVIAGAAIIGDNTGYEIGRRLGPRLFRKKDGILFRKEYIDRSQAFFEKHGSKTMLVAHFIPIVRAFAPLVAGVGNMTRRQFIIYDAIGDIVWACSLTLLGYFVGSKIPGVEHYIEPVMIVIVLAFFLPTLWHVFSDPKIRATLKKKFSRTKSEKPDLE